MTVPTDTELKALDACRHCGGQPKRVNSTGQYPGHYYECPDCGLCMGPFPSAEEMEEAIADLEAMPRTPAPAVDRKDWLTVDETNAFCNWIMAHADFEDSDYSVEELDALCRMALSALSQATAATLPGWETGPCNQCGGYGGHEEGCTGHKAQATAATGEGEKV